MTHRLTRRESRQVRTQRVNRPAPGATTPDRWNGPADIAWCDEHGLHGARDHCFECGKLVEQIRMLPLNELRAYCEEAIARADAIRRTSASEVIYNLADGQIAALNEVLRHFGLLDSPDVHGSDAEPKGGPGWLRQALADFVDMGIRQGRNPRPRPSDKPTPPTDPGKPTRRGPGA